MKVKSILFALGITSVLVGCSSTPNQHQKLTEQLTDWMQGHFTSEAQSKQDKEFYNIHLNMVQIWPERTDGTWLYVEQAAIGYLDKPYRQRVYKLNREQGLTFASQVFTLTNPKEYAGAYKTPATFNKTSPAELTVKQGCTVYLTWDDANQSYSGATKAKQCISNLRGASYATSDVIVTKDGILSWDKGFDAADKQVWGAVKAGYQFDRQ